jgi:hypothetical protein
MTARYRLPGMSTRDDNFEAMLSQSRFSGLRRLLLTSVMYAIAACTAGDRPEPESSGQTRSVGAGNASSHRPINWVVADSPDVVIGSATGENADAFGLVTGATVLTDGRIAVTDLRAAEIRFFTETGSYIGSTGRRGEGPGEYGSITGLLRLDGDTLVVADVALRRITILNGTGEYIRSFTPTPLASSEMNLLGPLDAGHVMLHAGSRALQLQGRSRDTMIIGIMRIDSGKVNVVAREPGEEYLLSGTATSSRMTWAPFARSTYVGSSNGVYAIGTSDADRIVIVNTRDGSRSNVVPVRSASEVRPGDLIRFQGAVAELRGRPVPARADMSQAPPTTPYFERLLIDALGYLWVRRYTPLWQSDEADWDVHNINGNWLGTIRLPTHPSVGMPFDRDVFEIGREHVLILHRDPLGVESVRKYRLIRNDTLVAKR